jgi:hypothetical protein
MSKETQQFDPEFKFEWPFLDPREISITIMGTTRPYQDHILAPQSWITLWEREHGSYHYVVPDEDIVRCWDLVRSHERFERELPNHIGGQARIFRFHGSSRS